MRIKKCAGKGAFFVGGTINPNREGCQNKPQDFRPNITSATKARRKTQATR